jgi:chromosome segregation ATPase
MSALELLQLLPALASAGAAVLLWRARARMLRQAEGLEAERLQAKDAQIAALAREAEALRDLMPIKIREYLVETHAQLREYCRAIEDGYRTARKEIEHCNAEITRRQEQGEWRAEGIDQLVERREALIGMTRAIKPELRELQHQCEFPEDFTIKIARMVPDAIEQLTEAYLALARQLPLDQAERLPALSGRVVQSFKYRLDQNSLFSSTLFARQNQAADGAEIWQRPDNGE